jgi:hypothetical protein
MRIILEDVPDNVGRELLQWLATRTDGLAVSIEADWTEDRAARLLAELPPAPPSRATVGSPATPSALSTVSVR